MKEGGSRGKGGSRENWGSRGKRGKKGEAGETVRGRRREGTKARKCERMTGEIIRAFVLSPFRAFSQFPRFSLLPRLLLLFPASPAPYILFKTFCYFCRRNFNDFTERFNAFRLFVKIKM